MRRAMLTARAPSWAAALLVAMAILARSTFAAAAGGTVKDPYEEPHVPRSMVLPELTHPDVEWTATSGIGGLSLEDGNGGHQTSAVFTERFSIELPVALHRWFAGIAYTFAGGAPGASPGPATLVGGNLELRARTVWATRTGLAFGGGLGVVAPVATFSRGGASGNVARAAASLEPDDAPFFRPGLVTGRAFVDVRDLVGRFVIQFRQSLDGSIDTAGADSAFVSVSSNLYAGYLISDHLGAGLDITELYQIGEDVPDADRPHLLVAPSVRLITASVQPALSPFVSVGQPFLAGAAIVYGVRFGLTVLWDPTVAYSPEQEAK